MEQRKKESRGVVWRTVFTGSVLTNAHLTKRLPVFIVLGLLMIVYIYVGFSVQRRHNHLENLNNELMELRTVAVTTSALRQQLTRRQNIEELLKKYNIKISQGTTPPKVIAHQ